MPSASLLLLLVTALPSLSSAPPAPSAMRSESGRYVCDEYTGALLAYADQDFSMLYQVSAELGRGVLGVVKAVEQRGGGSGGSGGSEHEWAAKFVREGDTEADHQLRCE